jgi:SAM-dependent methyltransferase
VQPDPSASPKILPERALGGFHAFVMESLPRPLSAGLRAIDLGSGSGAFAQRLSDAGWAAEAVDRDRSSFGAAVPFHEVDLDRSPWPFDARSYALVSAIEVIEHVRDPIGFLTNIGELLDDAGFAVVTSPNMDSLATRVKFLLRGTLRQMDGAGDATHISPIFMDLLRRRYLPAAGLELAMRLVYPPAGHLASRPMVRGAARAVGFLVPGTLVGDTNVLILRRERSL